MKISQLKQLIKEEVLKEIADASLTKIAAITTNERGKNKKFDPYQAAGDLTGQAVKPTSLVPGQIYMMKERSTAHHFNYSQDTFPVIFIGVGNDSWDKEAHRSKYEWFGAQKNPKVKDLADAKYYFKAVQADLRGRVKKVYLFGAYGWKGSLAIGSGATNVSLYKLDPEAVKKYNVQ